MKPIKTLLLASVLASAFAGAAVLKTDPAKSSVSATFKQMGVPVEAKFKQFNAQIDYDAAKPAASKATVEIQTASLDMGDPEYNKEITKKEWFNTAQFPKASFVSSSIAAAGAGKLNVSGKLTIKGRSANVSFPLSVRTEAGKQVFEGQLPIKRLAFNIGEDEWKDTSMVADEVVIKFRVAAAQ
ncbi:MAG: polyisoprenoid-binding protein [Lysobacteraceae bacterium]|nr:MAG: polyisoprenoid-binding protein [Xanthomonadaceae bacterium]